MSKALEALERIGNEYSIDESVFYKEDFKQVRMELEALEIIKEKECDMRWFKYCIKVNSEVETYNNGLPEYYEKLTQEQFNLLKEVLEWFLKFGHW